MKVPSENELIDHPAGLDEYCVIEHFGGKTAEEAYRMFADSACLYCEDIMYMSVLALGYYLPAALAYLQSSEAEGDWDCASGVLMAFSDVCRRADLTPEVVKIIRDITSYVAAHPAKFNAADDEDWIWSRIRVIRKHLPECEAPSE